MEKMHQCVLCIGSNYHAEMHMNIAEKVLRHYFPCIRWGKTIQTAPEGSIHHAPYLNRAALFETTWDPDSLRSFFKNIEKACGRTPASKQTGIIPLDIDLLMIDGVVCKPADMQKNMCTWHYMGWRYKNGLCDLSPQIY